MTSVCQMSIWIGDHPRPDYLPGKPLWAWQWPALAREPAQTEEERTWRMPRGWATPYSRVRRHKKLSCIFCFFIFVVFILFFRERLREFHRERCCAAWPARGWQCGPSNDTPYALARYCSHGSGCRRQGYRQTFHSEVKNYILFEILFWIQVQSVSLHLVMKIIWVPFLFPDGTRSRQRNTNSSQNTPSFCPDLTKTFTMWNES